MYSSGTIKAKFRITRAMISDVIDMFEKDLKFSDETDSHVTVTANVNEIAMLQFAKNYSTNVVVLEPQTLVEKLRQEAERALKIYSK